MEHMKSSLKNRDSIWPEVKAVVEILLKKGQKIEEQTRITHISVFITMYTIGDLSFSRKDTWGVNYSEESTYYLFYKNNTIAVSNLLEEDFLWIEDQYRLQEQGLKEEMGRKAKTEFEEYLTNIQNEKFF